LKCQNLRKLQRREEYKNWFHHVSGLGSKEPNKEVAYIYCGNFINYFFIAKVDFFKNKNYLALECQTWKSTMVYMGDIQEPMV
jgi:hypothetical protein